MPEQKPTRIVPTKYYLKRFDRLTDNQRRDLSEVLRAILNPNIQFSVGQNVSVLNGKIDNVSIWYFRVGGGNNIRVTAHIDDENTWWLLTIETHDSLEQPKTKKKITKIIKKIEKERSEEKQAPPKRAKRN